MKKLLIAPMIATTLFTLAPPASAGVNCYAARSRSVLLNCLRQHEQIYRNQSRAYNDIARGQYNTHRRVGRYLKRAPYIGRSAARAWNYPRYYYRFRYGRP